MKLPEERSERIKLFTLIGVVCVFVLYLLGSTAIRPLLKKRADQREQIAQLKTELETAQRVTDFVNSSRAVNAEVIGEIARITEDGNCILKPRLGNYLLEATEIIEAEAKESAVPVASVKEAGISEAPSPGKDSGPGMFNLYTVRVDTQCGMHDLMRLLRGIEQSNPYLSIAGIAITGRGATPAAHSVAFNVQWPIWKDEGALDTIRKLAELPGEDK